MALTFTPDQINSMATKVDDYNQQIQGELKRFKGHADSIAHTAWQGDAYKSYVDVVSRWDADAIKLQNALSQIADNMRANSKSLAEESEKHAHGIQSAANGLTS